MTTRSPYNGTSRKLVLAFDLGTTYSGVSYSILDPGQVPEIQGVTRFPAQERVGGDSKIPTIIYYDKNGAVRAVGAEAMSESIQETAEDEGWSKAEWFKLHLRPKTTSSTGVTQSLPPLPHDKSAVDLFADFMRYLFTCTKIYIQETHANGVDLWASVEKHIEVVLSHPNGWEGAQQGLMRKAAIQAGLVPDTPGGYERVHFVTEGEASLHFCIQSELTEDTMKKGDGVLIVDAGGGTIDISAYGQNPSSKGLSFEEIAPPQCHFQGSVFVTKRAEAFLKNLLQGSNFAEDIDNITTCFDRSTKLTFRSIVESQFIKFGSARDKDPKLNIRAGQLRLSGVDVSTFFEPAILSITEAIKEQCANAQRPITSVFLVGGFAASPWLFAKLKESLEPLGLNFCRPDSHVNKAVADGAVSFYLDHFVAIRVAKYSYGTLSSAIYDPLNDEHIKRHSSVCTAVDGVQLVPLAFDVILRKGTRVAEKTEFRRHYTIMDQDRSRLRSISESIMCYRGSGNARWTDEDSEMYSTLCYVEADMLEKNKTLAPQYQQKTREKNQQPYYQLDYGIVLSFGLTELKAQICWHENGTEKRSPAKIVYDADTVINDKTNPR